jgi:hypothetical protein
LIDRGGARIPDPFRGVFAEGVRDFLPRQIGHGRKVRGGVPGVGARAPFTFQQSHRSSRLFQQIGRSDTHDPAANHDHVDLEITVDFWKARQRRGVDPVRRGIHNSNAVHSTNDRAVLRARTAKPSSRSVVALRSRNNRA